MLTPNGACFSAIRREPFVLFGSIYCERTKNLLPLPLLDFA